MGVFEDLTMVSAHSSSLMAFRRGRGGGDGMEDAPDEEAVEDVKGGANILNQGQKRGHKGVERDR